MVCGSGWCALRLGEGALRLGESALRLGEGALRLGDRVVGDQLDLAKSYPST